MLPVAALLDTSAALGTLRRTYPPGLGRIRGCRSVEALNRVIEVGPIDALVIGTGSVARVDLPAWRSRYPVVPVIVYGPVRPDQGTALLELAAREVRAIAVEGIDDPVVGELVARNGYLAGRRAALADLPRLLRLTEPLQRRAFDLLVGWIGKPPATAAIARRLGGSREHLSRQFGAGGAPNLKRVVDLLRLLAARDLLQGSGRPVPGVAEVLGFSSLSHFRASVRRLVRMAPADLALATGTEVIRRFLSAGSRSREGRGR